MYKRLKKEEECNQKNKIEYTVPLYSIHVLIVKLIYIFIMSCPCLLRHDDL